MEKIIGGIQQIGVGVPNVEKIWKWYRTFFGADIKVFEEEAEAALMTKYTGNVVHSRKATLALSMDGGGGFEIWQFVTRKTKKPSFDLRLGDFGLFACLIKSRDVRKSFEYFRDNGAKILGDLSTSPSGCYSFYVEDPNGNIFNIVEGCGWFENTKHPSHCGTVAGSMIGVSDMDKALLLYRDILGYETVEYDVTDVFPDFSGLPAGNQKVRRILLAHKEARKGPFSRLLGPSKIELVQSVERKDCRRIFENRFWGDWGFIHLCFDVQGMDELKEECARNGFPFTVDSSETFDMGEAGGRFSYILDQDGTWIEFVEAHKVPIMKKLGWYIYPHKRKPGKQLPNWILRAMKINRVKD